MVVNNSHGLILITQSVSFSSPKSFLKLWAHHEIILKRISCFLVFTTTGNAIVKPKPTVKYHLQ